VTLSACRTGVGRVVPGEGVLALARAFLDAGASRVLASLWKVSDEPTAELMTGLYEGYLGRGLAPAAALRRAQLAMLAEPATASPSHWAAFVLQGDWRRPAHHPAGGDAEGESR
jgi:CHAT domain-containing protein